MNADSITCIYTYIKIFLNSTATCTYFSNAPNFSLYLTLLNDIELHWVDLLYHNSLQV